MPAAKTYIDLRTEEKRLGKLEKAGITLKNPETTGISAAQESN